MDNVQFPRNSWVNRVLAGGTGKPMWLTVPVRHGGHLDLRIADVEISWETDWRVKHLKSLRQRYARSPYLGSILDPIERVLARRHRLLGDQNVELIEALMRLAGIERRVIRGSQLKASGSGSALIVAICREIGATRYLAGQGAAAYEDLTAYAEAGIEYLKAGFVHPEYPQRGQDSFTPGLSILDALLNVGPEQTRRFLLQSVQPSGG
jgi:hypothetical protein